MATRALLLFVFGSVLGLSYVDDVQACHVEYVLKEKDTLESIAHQIYNDHTKWRIIYYANLDRVDGTSLLKPGTAIRLPCTAGKAPVPPPASPSPAPQEKLAIGSLDAKEKPGTIVPFHLTSTNGIGAKVGFIVARNARISIGSRLEDALVLSPFLEGLPPGPHAFHVHANPDCGPGQEGGKAVPGLAAGPHLFLKGTGTDAKVTYHSHLGNLPNLIVAKDGTAKGEIAVPRLTLDDIRGRSMIIHATREDDSARQACGVVP
jgi:superoxide dismutase, Cu-Zn family